MACHQHAFLFRFIPSQLLRTISIRLHLSHLRVHFKAEKVRSSQQGPQTFGLQTRLFLPLRQHFTKPLPISLNRKRVKLTVRFKISRQRSHAVFPLDHFLNQVFAAEVLFLVDVVAVGVDYFYYVFSLQIFMALQLLLELRDKYCTGVEAKVRLRKYYKQGSLRRNSYR